MDESTIDEDRVSVPKIQLCLGSGVENASPKKKVEHREQTLTNKQTNELNKM